MSDQNDPGTPQSAPEQPQNPTPVPAAPQPPIQIVVNPVQPSVTAQTAVETVEAAVRVGFAATVKALWNKYGIVFILVGAGILVAKFNNLILDILGVESKKDLQVAQKKDDELKAQENAANQQADDLVKQANDLPGQEKPVDENWDKKQ